MNDDSMCVTDGCIGDVKIKARGLCGRCYQRAWKDGTLVGEVRPGRKPELRQCSKVDCTLIHKAEGLCKRHLDEARRTGDLPAAICTFQDCGRVQHIQRIGLCLPHYRQRRAGKSLTPIAKRQKRQGTCAGPECGDPVRAAGLCGTHHSQSLAGRELTPIRRITVDRRGRSCTACLQHGDDRPSYTSEGLCRVHARRKTEGEEGWARAVPRKAPNGAGHINEDGYRIITVKGRNVGEHRHFMEGLLGRPLAGQETVHHRNGNRADNRTDGPLRLVNGKLQSGNLELWSTSQPAGQEIGPKLEWAVELLEEYGEFVPEELLERMAAALNRRGWSVTPPRRVVRVLPAEFVQQAMAEGAVEAAERILREE
jgi:hypothetical protein